MATVLPFAGMRPPKTLAEKVAAPPYDVVTSGEARILAEGNPWSFLHINKPEIDLDPSIDPFDDAVYRKGGENMRRFLREGTFVRDTAARFYIYRQETDSHCQTGVVGLVSADEYENGIILRHELTRPDKENDRVRHMAAVEAQTGPVFLTYRSEKNIDDLVEQCIVAAPEYDFVSDGVRHMLWVVDEREIIAGLEELFSRIPVLFIADGHHRSAAAVRYRDLCRQDNPSHNGNEAYNYFMAVLFPHDQLRIMDYNRVVRDLGGMSAGEFIEAVSVHFIVAPCEGPARPAREHEFGMYLGGQWYRLQFKGQLPRDPVAALDVSILQDTLLSPVLGITDPRTDARVDFIGGGRGLKVLEQAVDEGEYAAAFACYPESIEKLMTIAEAGKLMPPKSTWFEPKLKSGLVLHYLGPVS